MTRMNAEEFKQHYGVSLPENAEAATRLMLDVAAHPKAQHVVELMGALVQMGADVERTDAQGNTVPMLLLRSGQMPGPELGTQPDPLAFFDWMRPNQHGHYAALSFFNTWPAQKTTILFSVSQRNLDLRKVVEDVGKHLSTQDNVELAIHNDFDISREIRQKKIDAMNSLNRCIIPEVNPVMERYAGRYGALDMPDRVMAVVDEGMHSVMYHTLFRAGHFDEITKADHWKGREEDFVIAAAAMDTGWRERLKSHPLLQDRWQRSTWKPDKDETFSKEYLLTADGKPKLQLLVWALNSQTRHLMDVSRWAGGADAMMHCLNAIPEKYLDKTALAQMQRESPLAHPDESVLVSYARHADPQPLHGAHP